jgi:hypothetical protein
MTWYHYVSFAFGGLFLANAIPHAVSGMMGRPFQSPFAKPPGEGFSSSTVNVLWGWFNLVVAYVLLVRVGEFDLHDTGHILVAGLPAFGGSMMAARAFGRFNGGNDPLAHPSKSQKGT